MIIILSPAKTFNKTITSFDHTPYFQRDAEHLIKQLQEVPLKSLMSHMKISQKLAIETQKLYRDFGIVKTAAIHGYYGHQYKYLDIDHIEMNGYKKQAESLYILSGLYGIINAYDGISPYRLEMKDKTLINLYHYWQPKICDYVTMYFKDDVIYNLASDEYGKLISHLPNVITIQFFIKKNDQLSIHSMEAKKMRGLMAQYLIMHQKDDITSIMIENYLFHAELSNHRTIVFVRDIS